MVNIDRSGWLDLSPLAMPNWFIPNITIGSFSIGIIDDNNNSKTFPVLPTGFAVAKKVVINGNWTVADSEFIKIYDSGG